MSYLRRRRLIELASLDHPWLGPLAMRAADRRAAAPSSQYWDDQYRADGLARLARSDERHHHRLLAALACEYRPNPRVLEVGCGEGHFLTSLRPLGPAHYAGIDLSEVAIARARALHAELVARGLARFEVAEGRHPELSTSLDVILFPECLEYLGDPIDLFETYRRSLSPGGIIGVSLWLTLRGVRLWHRIRGSMTILEEALVQTPRGGAWLVGILRFP